MRGGGRRCHFHRQRAAEPSELLVDELDRAVQARPVLLLIEPAADSRGVWQRDRDGSSMLEALPDARIEARETEQPASGKPADRDDQPGPQQAKLPLLPERTELLLPRGRRPVTTAARCASRVAARDRGAVERRVELLLVELEPPAQGLACATTPGTALFSLDDSRRLPENVRPLSRTAFEDRQRLERVARLGARAADAGVALKRVQRAVRRAPAGQAGERTTTNQRPSKRTSPPPSSEASPSPVKNRL